MNESWRIVWRDGFQPSLSTAGLERLLDWLRRDDSRLIQGSTTTPPPLMCVQDWPLEACDAIALAAVEDFDCSVGVAEEAFAKACFEADQRLGEPAACRWFLNWFDDTPRNEVFRELADEVEYELATRANFVGLVPAEFAAAYVTASEDSTLAGAVAGWFFERNDLRAASVWRRRRLQLESQR